MENVDFESGKAWHLFYRWPKSGFGTIEWCHENKSRWTLWTRKKDKQQETGDQYHGLYITFRYEDN